MIQEIEQVESGSGGTLSTLKQVGPDRRRTGAETDAARDAVLVRRCNAGDEKAFNEIVAHYRERLYFVALGVLRNRCDAEEIAQDALLRAYRALPFFRGDCTLSTWLTRITLNLAYNRYWYFSRRHRQDWVSLDEAVGDDNDAKIIDLVGDDAASPARGLATAEFSALVTRCMKKLRPRQREILTLRAVRDRPYEEIARTLGAELGTVKSRIGRARNELRRLMAESCPEFAPNATPSEWFEPVRSGGRLKALCA